ARSFDAIKTYQMVVEERRKDSDCVRSTADTSDDCIRQLSSPLEKLFAGLLTNHGLKVPYDSGVRMRSCNRADAIVSVAYVRHPIAKGFVHGILERSGSSIDMVYRRSEHVHSSNIGCLPSHIFRAHVYLAT